jgi:putrescine transport system substrate-binding protein
MVRGVARALLCAAAMGFIAACGREGAQPVVNVYSWPGYVADGTLADFEARTGIRVNYGVMDSNQILETKLLAGRSGYDVVVPGAAYVERLAKAGVLASLDKAKLPHLRHLDPAVTAAVRRQDPRNEYGVPYLWGTNGFAYNREAIRARMPDAPLDSWDMLFSPAVVARFADCGVVFYDTPIAVVPHVLAWLGRDPNSEDLADLALAEKALRAVRPYLRYLSNVRQFADLANGEVCLAFSDNGNALQARARAREAGRSFTIAYSVPREGAQLWFDLLAIPADAPHPDAAHRFIDYLLEPHVAAAISTATGFATANLSAQSLLAPAVRGDPIIYPPPRERARLFPDPMKPDAYLRERLRMWQRFMR